MINVVMGILDNASCKKLKANFLNLLKKELGKQYDIGTVDYVYTKADFESSLSTKIYNFGIILEKIGSDAIGQGALRKWRNEYPDTRIILLMDNGKKGSAKANGLYVRNYYDGLFEKDLGKAPMISLFLKERTAEEAYDYYAVEVFESQNKKKEEDVTESNKDATSPNKETIKNLEQPYHEVSEALENVEHSAYISLPAPIKAPAQKKKETTPVNKFGTLELNENPLEKDIDILEEIVDELEVEFVEESSSFNEIDTETQVVDDTYKEQPETSTEVKAIEKKESSKAAEEKTVGKLSIENKEPVAKEVVTKATNENNKAKKEPKRKDENFVADVTQAEPYEKVSNEKRKKNQFDTNKHQTSVDIVDRLNDEEYLKKYIQEYTKEANRDHKDSKGYSHTINKAFMTALEEFYYRSEASLNELIKSGKMVFAQFVFEQLGEIIKNSNAKTSDKEKAQDMFYDFCFEYDLLNSLIADENITDIHVVNYDTIRVKQNGERKTSLKTFYSEEHYKRFVKNLLIRHENSFTSKGVCTTYVDKEFSDKYSLTVTIVEDSINKNGISELIISKSFQSKIPLENMIGEKCSLQQAAKILNAIQNQKGILFCGPNKCGSTTFMNALLEYIPKWKSAIVMQHSNELFVKNHPEVTIWHPILGTSGKKEKTLDKLCDAALQLDVDYYILGDSKGKEALSLYKAINYGYTAWTTVRASSCENAFDNLLNMIIEAQPVLDKATVMKVLKAKFETVVYMEDKKIVELVDNSIF